MTDLPLHVEIHEEGPREGFQIEPGPISTSDKIRLIEALAETGLHHIQAGSFVNPRDCPRLGRRGRGRGRLQAKTRRPLHCAVVQRQRTEPSACLSRQADDHRLHLANRVGGIHAKEPAPQSGKSGGDAQADSAAPFA